MFNRLSIILTFLIVTEINCQRAFIGHLNARSRLPRTNCLQGDCHPETGDLLIGRTKFLHASSTCGLESPERYCVLGATRDATKCFVCDSSEPFDSYTNNNSHTIENIVSRQPGDRFSRWWQSENGRQDVYLQFDLEAEFSFTHIIMTFKTFRPAAMVIEKSSDFGSSWKPYAYFAYNCEESFPGIPTNQQRRLGDVYCESKYSSETPSTRGEIIFRVLPPTLVQSKDPYSSEIQDLLKITNLRVNFTKLHTFGDNLLDVRDEIKEKYYYALYEMVVRGSCLCYGHASRCIEVDGVQYDVADTKGMVHGQCECTHNTGGTNCEQCLPLYNDVPWKPARNGERNECKKCQCNNHALKCHFNKTIFDESNGVSGGVCDNCGDNTMGRNCELCKPNHYRDPNRPVEDPFTCRPCQCFVPGSLNDAKCDPQTDSEADLVAGRCYCKANVEGDKCDRCQNGFFNLTSANPEGCEPCSCNLIGTTGNLGCDKVSGSCSCKQNVAGRACDQCAPGFYGLSADDPNGCKPCDCAVGGSLNNTCNPLSGQCFCVPNMIGRQCDKPEAGHFCPAISHLVYDAEEATKLDTRSQDVLRQLYTDRRQQWTGPGYVKVFEGAVIEFVVDDVPTAGSYEIAVRYEQQMAVPWENLRVQVIRETSVDPDGPCANYNPADDDKHTSLPYDVLYHIVEPPSCLEPNKRYKVRLEFLKFTQNPPSNNNAAILIDSIVLVPVVNSLDIFKDGGNERLLEEYNHYNCRGAELHAFRHSLNDVCDKYTCSVGVAAISALPCKCDLTGSLSNDCSQAGGACKCKPNVVGRQCDQCAPSTWGFGPSGCQACNCNSGGAKNDFCNLETGVCDCFENVQGAKCNECAPNHWSFPSCIPCNCNGLADSCNQTTGECINCKDHTVGFYCDKCKDGYYGEPTRGLACKECMCPGGSTGNKFADTCYIDSRIDSVRCNCHVGYVGSKCEKCDVFYYGNPLEVGGSCQQCQCNGNVDSNDQESCDQDTGKCNNCLHNTDGEHCEFCKDGFYGNASNHECQPCNCYPDGTVGNTDANCDRFTGQCKCLPNVVGKYCDQCKADHYGLASGTGCVECECDEDGTHGNSKTCDLSTGQCSCLPSRGGRTCSECSFGYWGDPNVECKRCECTVSGSLNEQCDRLTGACSCRKGIAGYNCDRCDRGTFGEIPFCSQCGECFDDWTNILDGIKLELENLERKASNLAVASTSSVKDFMNQYLAIEEKLNDVKKILSTNNTDRQVQSLSQSIANLEKQIKAKRDSKSVILYSIEVWNNPAQELTAAQEEYHAYSAQTKELENELTSIKESTISGAISSITNANKVVNEAAKTTELTKNRIGDEFKLLLEHINHFTENEAQKVQQTFERLNKYAKDVSKNISNAHSILSDLNSNICGASTSEAELCDSKCGGAGCNGKCGTNSSSCSGLVDAYWSLVQARQRFENLHNQQELAFKKLLTKWRNSTVVLVHTNKDVEALVEKANASLKLIEMKHEKLSKLADEIKQFVEKNTNLPQKIEDDINYTLNRNHEVTEEQLDEVLTKIAALAATIQIDSLQEEAQKSRKEADALLNSVTHVSLYLPGIQADLSRTQASLESNQNKTKQNEESIEHVIDANVLVNQELKNSRSNTDNTRSALGEIEKFVDELRSFVDNKDKNSVSAKQESLKAKVKESSVSLERTKNNLEQLKSKYDEVLKKLGTFKNDSDVNNNNYVATLIVNLQANILSRKQTFDERLAKLNKLESEYTNSKSRISSLNKVIANLHIRSVELQKAIYDKSAFYHNCG